MNRKFSADYIFNGYRFLQNQVLITDQAGIVVECIEKRDAGDGIERLKGILSPGFINAHCHLELSHMKGLIPKLTGMVDFLLNVVRERHHNEAEILSAIEAAEREMYRNGIVAVGDICNNAFSLAQKTKGILQYHNFIETSGFPPSIAETRLAAAETVNKQYRKALGKQGSTICPHAPYSLSPELFRLINDLPDNNLLTIHNQEAEAENEFFEKGTGDMFRLYKKMGIDISYFKPSKKSSLQTWLPEFSKKQSIILVHNVCISASDMEFANSRLRTHDAELPPLNSLLFFCLCPNANKYINNRLPDVQMLMKHTDNIVLGTDSLASNDQLSILEEMKTWQQNDAGLTLELLLKWATSNGSKALQLDDRLGCFAAGKQPGLVLIEGVEELRLGSDSSARRIL